MVLFSLLLQLFTALPAGLVLGYSCRSILNDITINLGYDLYSSVINYEVKQFLGYF